MTTTLDMLGEQFEALNEALRSVEPGSREYHEIAKDLELVQSLILKEQKAETENEFRNVQEDRAERQLALEEAKEERMREEAKKAFLERIDPNTIVSALVTIGTTFAILDFEKLGNITSKAMSFVPKPKFK